MKKLCFAWLLFLSSVSFGQKDTYEIAESPVNIELSDYHLAMSRADFDSFRLPNGRRKLTFQNGLVIELKSVSELVKSGIQVDGNKCLKNGIPSGYVEPIYNLVNGNIVANYSKQNKK